MRLEVLIRHYQFFIYQKILQHYIQEHQREI